MRLFSTTLRLVGALVLLAGCSAQNTKGSSLAGLASGIKEYQACQSTYDARLRASLHEVSIDGSADKIAREIAQSLPAEEAGIIVQTVRAAGDEEVLAAQSNFDASVRVLGSLDERFAATNICGMERSISNSYAFSSVIREGLQSRGLDVGVVFAPSIQDASNDVVERQILLALLMATKGNRGKGGGKGPE